MSATRYWTFAMWEVDPEDTQAICVYKEADYLALQRQLAAAQADVKQAHEVVQIRDGEITRLKDELSGADATAKQWESNARFADDKLATLQHAADEVVREAKEIMALKDSYDMTVDPRFRHEYERAYAFIQKVSHGR